MNAQQKTELRTHLAKLDARERKECTRLAAELRTKAQDAKAKEANRPVEWFLLDLLVRRENMSPPAVVIGVDRTQCIVRIDGEDIAVRSLRDGTEVAPGDEVVIYNDAISEVLTRRTTLMRKETGGQRLIAANVDLVLVVVSVVSPPLHPRLIDRYLAAINNGGAEAAVVINKSDLGINEEDQSAIDIYTKVVPVFTTSAEDKNGIADLREFIKARITALVGHSGVGKSSLLNALIGDRIAETGTVSFDTGKGQHTTTRSTLHELNGLRILDTPGIREFAVHFEDPFEVVEGFSEIARIGGACRFSDCLHIKDRDCAVIKAVRSGAIHEDRYESYRKLLAESFPALG